MRRGTDDRGRCLRLRAGRWRRSRLQLLDVDRARLLLPRACSSSVLDGCRGLPNMVPLAHECVIGAVLLLVLGSALTALGIVLWLRCRAWCVLESLLLSLLALHLNILLGTDLFAARDLHLLVGLAASGLLDQELVFRVQDRQRLALVVRQVRRVRLNHVLQYIVLLCMVWYLGTTFCAAGLQLGHRA